MEEEREYDLIKKSEQERKVEYKKLKLKLDEFQNGKKWKHSLFSAIVSGTIVLFFEVFMLSFIEIDTFYVFFYSIAVVSVIIFSFMIYYFMLDSQESSIRRKMLEYETENIQESVQNDVFENSIKMSYKYLDQYYLQIRDQAQKGFFVTVCVSVFGAILIGVGIVLMFMDITNPSYITCASGVITEFIATIFFYMYNKTVTSMSKYHNKLVLSHNISIALKVADTLPEEDKVKSKNLIISELLKDMNSHLIRSDSEDEKK